ncbi:MAG: InlB B-repeat-containing protein, partial [Lachnospiraceae bacterium]|nr:InlB B-repeat-containing protein [Lachnospiraceae bacterium]
MKEMSRKSAEQRERASGRKQGAIGWKALFALFCFLLTVSCHPEKAFASSAEPLSLYEEDEFSELSALGTDLSDTDPDGSNAAQCRALLGSWDGVYYNSQGIMKLQLAIDDVLLDGSVTAVFSFSEHPDNPGTPSGSYRMKGSYHFDSHALSLNGDAWIDRPGTWDFLSIQASVDPENRKMTGKTGGYSGLELTKTSDSEWKNYSNIEQVKVLLGSWDGFYFASQGKTALKLSILQITLDGKVEGRFDFSEHPDNPGVPTGSYTMKGTYDFAGHKLNLNGVDWIEHPPTYHILSVNGKVNTGARTMSGSTGGYSGLTLSKSGADREVFTIHAQSADGGAIKPEVGVYVQQGENQSFDICPDKGYMISDVEVDGTSVGGVSNYVFRNVAANHEIKAFFKVPDPHVVTYADNDPININYSGKAVFHVHLIDETGMPIAEPGELLTYFSAAGENKVRVDRDGCVDVLSDTYTFSESGQNKHTFSAVLRNQSGKEIAIVSINQIQVSDLAFSQKWNAKMDVSGTAELGAGVGGSIGPAEAEASLGGVSATGSAAATMELVNSYEQGQRNLNISQKYDKKVGVKGSIGPKAEALNDAVEIKALEVSGSAGVGQQVSSGIKIKNYDPSDPANALNIGRFLLCGAAESSGDVYLMRLLELLGYEGASDVIGSKVSLEGKGGIDFLTVSAGSGNIKAEASVMAAETGGVLTFEASRDKSGSNGPVFTKKKSYTRNASVNMFNVSIKGFKESPVSFETGFFGPNLSDEHVTDVSVSGKINSLYDTKKTVNNITKITYGGTVYQDGGIGGIDLVDRHSELSHQVVYDEQSARIVAGQVPAVGNFYESFIGGLSKDDIREIEQCKTAQATFSDTYTEKATVNIPLSLGLKAGVGLEAGIGLKGVYEESYDIDGGTYNYDEEKDERVEIKRNVCDSEIVESRIAESKTDILTVLTEPIASLANFVVEKAKDVVAQAGENIKNGFAAVYNTTSSWAAHVIRLTNDTATNALGADASSALSTSYEICTYSGIEISDESGNGQEKERIASTVGEPYLVYLTDENGQAVSDWGGESLTLIMEYTDEMLKAAGASEEDAPALAIYRYSQDKLGYIYLGGTVDPVNRTVTLAITEEGQYILAIDQTAPVVRVFATVDDSNPPVIVAGLDEMSGFREFSLKIDGEEVVNLANYDQYYDAETAAIRYPVKDPLTPGAHKATLMATDSLGNSMMAPAELDILIPDPAKETEITFDANGGYVLPVRQRFIIGEKYGDLPVPERKGHSFVGWFAEREGGTQITSGTLVKDNQIKVLYAHWIPEVVNETIVLEAGKTDFTLIPGESRRLGVSSTSRYIYGIRWTLDSASPKNCVTLKNGVVTAKKAGTAVITATYGGSSAEFHIKVDGKTYQNTVIKDGKKKYGITATKQITATVGAADKTVTISIPANLRAEGRNIQYKVLTNGVCAVGEPVYNKTDRTKASKARVAVTPLDAGATWILWTMKDGKGHTTQAATKVIVRKPVTELKFAESSMELAAGEGKLLAVTGTKDNTIAGNLVFSVNGKGVKVSKSGFVLGMIPGSTATVTVKSGKVTA